MFKYKRERIYICTVTEAKMAAVVNDIAMVQIKGLAAKTNFDYTMNEFIAILSLPNMIQVCKKSREQWKMI